MPIPRRKIVLGAALVGACIALSGCGYKPLYGASPGTAAQPALARDLARVQILPVSDRPGQILYNALKDEMHPRGADANPTHRLTVRLNQIKQNLGIRSDAEATRANLILIGMIQLQEIGSGRVVFQTTEQAVVSYNILDTNRYSTSISERNARRTGIETLAEQISRRVSLFMNRRRTVRSAPKS